VITDKSARAWVARVFTVVEDVVYVGLGLLLAGCSLALLVSGLINSQLTGQTRQRSSQPNLRHSTVTGSDDQESIQRALVATTVCG
jgi:hypothetical protein